MILLSAPPERLGIFLCGGRRLPAIATLFDFLEHYSLVQLPGSMQLRLWNGVLQQRSDLLWRPAALSANELISLVRIFDYQDWDELRCRCHRVDSQAHVTYGHLPNYVRLFDELDYHDIVHLPDERACRLRNDVFEIRSELLWNPCTEPANEIIGQVATFNEGDWKKLQSESRKPRCFINFVKPVPIRQV